MSGEPDDPALSRRQLLAGGFLARLVEGAAARLPVVAAPARRDAPRRGAASAPFLRPPGAIEESAFLADCTRCNECAAACPPNAIIPATSRARSAEGTPVIDPARSPCRVCDDPPCINACEPGVLTDAIPFRMGSAMIDTQTCLAHQRSTCTVCSEHCPVEGAIVVEAGRPRVSDACVGCGICHYVCPAPQNAVIVMPASDRPSRPRGERGVR